MVEGSDSKKIDYLCLQNQIMHIASAQFVQSSNKFAQCPEDRLPEFAFIGRSNVGKSSLINMLTDRPGLARVSKMPGKTQLINHFRINEAWYLVDLPGYGYARVSKGRRGEFSQLISDYVLGRQNMALLFVLIDSRLEPQRIDLDFIELLGRNGVPFALVFTKCDKQSADRTESNIARFRRVLREQWEELPPMFRTSSETRVGRDEVLNYVDSILENLAAEQAPR